MTTILFSERPLQLILRLSSPNSGCGAQIIIFNDNGMKQYLENYLKPKTWPYLRQHQQINQTAAVNLFFRIGSE